MGDHLKTLIIEDSPADAEILLRELQRSGFETEWQRVETAREMLDALERQQWDIIICDYAMPRFSGLDALRMVKERGLEIPFIICSGKIGEDAAVEAMQAGANDYLLKNSYTRLRYAIMRAKAEVEGRIRARKAEQESLLLKQAIDAIPIGVTISDASGKIIYTNPADAEMHGYTVEELLGREAKCLAPVKAWNKEHVPCNTYVTSMRESVNVRKDGSEFPVYLISLPVTYSEDIPSCAVTVCEDITARKEIESQLLYMSTHDSLTGLYNRAYFDLELERIDRSRHFPVSVIMIDVNGLKKINDQEGHQFGDLLLQETARILSEMFRAEDLVARIGGDEFIVLLPETDNETVTKAIERIKQVLEERPQKDGVPRVSLSLGAATALEPGTLMENVKRADKEMYLDKLTRCSREKRV
jgi:diguanylate cyclase (GGDEF)-like protein/PAS domain S-box-containing protein